MQKKGWIAAGRNRRRRKKPPPGLAFSFWLCYSMEKMKESDTKCKNKNKMI